MPPDTWREIATRKQKQRLGRIPNEWILPLSSSSTGASSDNVLNIPHQCGILSEEELRITENYDAIPLVEALAKGKLTSQDVVTAFCKRAAIAHQVTNCLTEIFFDDAITRAKELDTYFQRHKKPIGPLHGLPISLKDTFRVKGYDASIGIAGLCFKPATVNSALVDLLQQQGAVLYCKTNIPQTLMALDSHNNVFGRTLNPVNRHLTAGGSSGGEGALMAMRGSPIGIGTDVGGSIRIPAMCNGLVGVKPSHGRMPYAGQEGGSLPGTSKLAIEATAGPIARSAKDCELLLRVVGHASPHLFDPEVLPQQWEEQPPLRAPLLPSRPEQPLRIGIVRSDGHVMPLPPIQRLIEEVTSALRSPAQPSLEAIQVFDLDISSLGPRCLKVFNGITTIDGANNWFNHLDLTGEPLSPWLQGRLRRRLQKPLDEVRKLQAQKTELQTSFISVWKESGGYWLTPDSKAKRGDRTLDLIICPAAPHPVAPVDRWNTVNYTSIFNLLDYPAGILPVRNFCKADLEGEVPDTPPLNGWDNINRGLWTRVDRKIYLNSPMSVQLLTPRLMERKLVEAMVIIEKALAPLRSRFVEISKL